MSTAHFKSPGFPHLQSLPDGSSLRRHNLAMQRLVVAVQELSLARHLESVMTIVRRAAREIADADGATFVLRDHDQCHYVDEDAIGPLWKGQRFPMSACISGWTMLNRSPAAIEDIYLDPRIPADAYRPTFVKSLVMVPIRSAAPIGAIGTYWASPHRATEAEVEILQALANTTAVAMENVQVYQELEARVRERTAQLEAANRELEGFSYSVSHDLKAPLFNIDACAHMLMESVAGMPGQTAQLVGDISAQARRMAVMIDDLMRLAKYTHIELARQDIDLSTMADEISLRFRANDPARQVVFHIAPGLFLNADRGMIRIALENLISNAWKYSSKRDDAAISVGQTSMPDGALAFFVRDNGVGFDMTHARHLFAPYRRLHSSSEFEGTGVGLATVERIIRRHGGRIWAEAERGTGATFFFTIPAATAGC